MAGLLAFPAPVFIVLGAHFDFMTQTNSRVPRRPCRLSDPFLLIRATDELLEDSGCTLEEVVERAIAGAYDRESDYPSCDLMGDESASNIIAYWGFHRFDTFVPLVLADRMDELGHEEIATKHLRDERSPLRYRATIWKRGRPARRRANQHFRNLLHASFCFSLGSGTVFR